MQEKFDLWIRENKESITKSEKYSKTINTITNHLKNKLGYNINLYEISDPKEVLSTKDKYFSHDEFYIKNQTGNRMYSRALDLYIEFLELNVSKLNTTLNATEDIVSDSSLTELEKESIILSRIGQGKFRENLLKLWGHCAVSGFDDVRLLVASHIKPWRDSDNSEKIDKFNGLLLLPTYDKLFDIGLISFENNGKIKISNSLKDYEKLGISTNTKIELKNENQKYMEYHRENLFQL